ncbi:hypothetical protein IRJ41_013883 [Triplophysa rosa]|uniref:Uncharacterized protein n=1 Tax=Triplophysa rosa TaxID=992332 RepID=A0A9W7TSD4_TRIRA|nr:hypothetical protein IRJ41_013883 [Triplophysa rosa]
MRQQYIHVSTEGRKEEKDSAACKPVTQRETEREGAAHLPLQNRCQPAARTGELPQLTTSRQGKNQGIPQNLQQEEGGPTTESSASFTECCFSVELTGAILSNQFMIYFTFLRDIAENVAVSRKHERTVLETGFSIKDYIKDSTELMSTILHCRWQTDAVSCSNQGRATVLRSPAESPRDVEL